MTLLGQYICYFYSQIELIHIMLTDIYNFIRTSDPFSIPMLTILIGTGFFVGFVNTLAGMATVLSYALFMAMGMPINIANGTTRFGVLAQFAVSSALFKREGYLDLRTGAKVGIPVAIGSLAGAELVAILDPHIIEIAMGSILPFMAILLLVNRRAEKGGKPLMGDNFGPVKFIIFTIIGLYGGFTHAGVGILIILGSIYLLGMDMLRANAIKQFAVVIYTPVALSVFIWYDQINWPIALIYSIGNIAGAITATKIAIKWGAKFIKICVASAVVAISFWLIYKQFI